MTQQASQDTSRKIAPTGVAGLDDILIGGLRRRRMYLVEGVPGSGKTTLALQFLIEGAKNGEKVLYVTLSETEEELRTVADSHGWMLDGIEIRELTPSESALEPDEQNTMFHPSEVELASTTKRSWPTSNVTSRRGWCSTRCRSCGCSRGTRCATAGRFSRSSSSSSAGDCTVLLLDDLTGDDHDLQVQSIAHGVILLEQLHPEYGAERRRLRVRQVPRRRSSAAGTTTTSSTPADSRSSRAWSRPNTGTPRTRAKLPSGIAELDALLGGGLEAAAPAR